MSGITVPAPGVPKPQRRQQVQRRRFGTAVGRSDPDQNVVGTGLGVFHQHIEVPVLIEYAGVGQFEFGIVLPPPRVLIHQPRVRKLQAEDGYAREEV